MGGFDLDSLFSVEKFSGWLETYKEWGWWPGVALAFVETLIPFLPLAAISVANAAAYGMVQGPILSEIGAVTGSLLIFYLARKFGDRIGDWVKRKFPKSKKMFRKLKNKGFMPIFILSCLPFTPSLVLNLAAGITKVPFWTFAAAIILGKAVLIATFSYIGHNLEDMLREPWKLGLVAGGLVAVWLIERAVDKHQEAQEGQAS